MNAAGGLWVPPWWRMPAWFTAGKAQRDPATGKGKRNATTGKARRNTATNDECCCGCISATHCNLFSSCNSNTTPTHFTCTFSGLSGTTATTCRACGLGGGTVFLAENYDRDTLGAAFDFDGDWCLEQVTAGAGAGCTWAATSFLPRALRGGTTNSLACVCPGGSPPTTTNWDATPILRLQQLTPTTGQWFLEISTGSNSFFYARVAIPSLPFACNPASIGFSNELTNSTYTCNGVTYPYCNAFLPQNGTAPATFYQAWATVGTATVTPCC